MTNMTATEIAAAVADLTEAIRAKGYPRGFCDMNFNLIGHPVWRIYLRQSVSKDVLFTVEKETAFECINLARDAVKVVPNSIEIESMALRAALSAARKAGVDVAEIVGAGE